jgi:hypothetical protein
MAKVTGNYETLYIINPAVGEEGIAALVAKFKALAEEHGTRLRLTSGETAVSLTRSTTCSMVITC